MKDFQFRNDTRLLFRNDPVPDLTRLTSGKKVLFVYGGGSVKGNGCYADVTSAVEKGNGVLYELPSASRELSVVEQGIEMVKQHGIALIIGAGGAQIMDCAKLIVFGACHPNELWLYVKGEKNPYGEPHLPLILMPTYPSSGSEYGLGAVAADVRTGDFGTAYGIAAETAILTPKYALSLSKEMTAYTGLVTLVQLSASTLGDRNKVSYDIGVSIMRNVLAATRALQKHPDDLDARGAILYGAAMSTSGRLGLGKAENYAYDLYELEFLPEVLFGVPYRKSLTTIFPRFLQAMAKRHAEDVASYLRDVYGFDGDLAASIERLIREFEQLGVEMTFSGDFKDETCLSIPIETELSDLEVVRVIRDCLR